MIYGNANGAKVRIPPIFNLLFVPFADSHHLRDRFFELELPMTGDINKQVERV